MKFGKRDKTQVLLDINDEITVLTSHDPLHVLSLHHHVSNWLFGGRHVVEDEGPMATDEMITPSSVSLNVSEMGGVEAGAHLRGIVLLVGPCPRKDEPRTTRMEEGVEPHFNDAPSATPVVVSGAFRFYDISFIVVRDDRPVPFLRFGTIANHLITFLSFGSGAVR
jgi:hypothetical protein